MTYVTDFISKNLASRFFKYRLSMINDYNVIICCIKVVLNIYEGERLCGIILAFGGQASNNIAFSLQSASLDAPMKY